MVTSLSAAAIGFGVAGSVVPKVLISTYSSKATPPARLLARLFGSRNLALGILGLQLDGAALDAFIRTAVVMSAADAAFGLLAAPVDGLPASTGMATAVTGSIFAGLYAYALSLD